MLDSYWTALTFRRLLRKSETYFLIDVKLLNCIIFLKNILVDFNDPSYVCSPHSTIIVTVIIVVVLNIGLLAAFLVFYRLKRKQWAKRSASVSPASSSHLLTIAGHGSNTAKVYASAPPLPTRPKTASGSLGGGMAMGPPPVHNSGASPNVIYKRPGGDISSAGAASSRQRFSGLSASSLASLPRDWRTISTIFWYHKLHRVTGSVKKKLLLCPVSDGFLKWSVIRIILVCSYK